MLKTLTITNIILIEQAVIPFGRGLNVLSGETGSGKSAIMNALNLIFGAKTDTGNIRRGLEKASVEALFDIEENLKVQHLLEEGGITHEIGEDLIIRREIYLNGKSRIFINNQACQLSTLRQISPLLGLIAEQHANQWLLLTEKHRDIIDLYGGLHAAVQEFNQIFLEKNRSLSELNTFIESQTKRFREIETYKQEIEEIEKARLKNNEDETAFAEYSLLNLSETLTSKADEIEHALFGERSSIIAHLNKQKANFEQLAEMDSTLNEASLSFKNAVLEIQEAAYVLQSFKSRIEHNESRIFELNERLTLIALLKKKYGNSIEEIHSYLKEIKNKLESLENQDIKIEELQISLKALDEKCNQLSFKLTEERKHAAKKFETEMMQELTSLNMPKVIFEVDIKPQKRNATGDDLVEFYLTPNIGEQKIPIKISASGGELSRILLAIKTLLAGKELIPTLIFDEIDANIGGETASIVGQKLKAIGRQHQVICITHFPQVAKQAEHHFLVSKKEKNGRTLTHVTVLENLSKEEELLRMLGGKFIN